MTSPDYCRFRKIIVFVWAVVSLNALTLPIAEGQTDYRNFEGGTQKSPIITVAEHLRPTVVSISVRKPRDFSGQEYFWDPKRGNIKRYRSTLSQFGSGVIVSKDGYILTNNHVIDQASNIRVTLADNTEYEAFTVGQDPETDVALIRLVMDGRLEMDQVAPIGDSETLRVGEWVVAIGNPFGFQRTVSVGVVSAKGRILEDIEGGTPSFQDFIQTDASIHPGNSGGPLVNLKGQVIGINTAYRPTGSGIGFAIPINLASKVAEDLRETGKVIRGFLGVHPQELRGELAEAVGVHPGEGILVGDVKTGSPAVGAGIRRGDVITQVNGQRINDIIGYLRIIAGSRPGTRASVRILRDGSPMLLSCMIGWRNHTGAGSEDLDDSGSGVLSSGENAWMGMIVHDRGMIEAKRVNDQAEESVVVTYVEPGSASEERGIGQGDEILEIEGNRVSTLADYNSLSRKLDGENRPILFLFRKKDDEATTFIAMRNKN